MSAKHLQRNIFLLANQTLVIAFLVFEIINGVQPGVSALVHFGITSGLLALAAYVGLSNMNGSRVLTSFTALLHLVAWYFLFTVDSGPFFGFIADLILPFIIYCMIAFLLRFIFQDGGYPHKKSINMVLLVSALLPAVLKLFNDRWFALLHLLQYIISVLCILVVLISQRKRVGFFLKSEWKNLLPSVGVFCIAMAVYIAVFRHEPSFLENSGMFFFICLPIWSIFKIAYHNRKSVIASAPLRMAQTCVFIVAALLFLTGMTLLFGLDSMFLILAVQGILWFVILYYLIIMWNLAKAADTPATEHSPYVHALSEIEKEEALKKKFSNFLHDDVLQDLLSIKNLMSKAERPEVQELINDTLEKLNKTVRNQMQDYHFVILKNLTLKENYSNLLSELAQKFDARHIETTFDCQNDLFLAAPYHLILYRAIRELVTNAYKYSECTQLQVSLAQTDGLIELYVKDNGHARATDLEEALKNHMGKGLPSLCEQTLSLGGEFSITDNKPQGVCVHVSLPMKGDGSYQYFAHR